MPAAAPSPAAANAQAAAPSRGPHPPMFSGIDPASITMSATAASRSGDAWMPTATHATTKVATCPRITIEDAARTLTTVPPVPNADRRVRQLAGDRQTGTRTHCRCDDDSGAGDGDRREARCSQRERNPTCRPTPAPPPRGRAARPGPPRALRRPRVRPEKRGSRCARGRPRDGRRRSRRREEQCSGTASGSTPKPTRPTRASARDAARGSATARRRPRWSPRRAQARSPPGPPTRKRDLGRTARLPRVRMIATRMPAPTPARTNALGARRGADPPRRPRAHGRAHDGHASRSWWCTTTRSVPSVSCAPRCLQVLVGPLLEGRSLLDRSGDPAFQPFADEPGLRRVQPPGRAVDAHRPPGGPEEVDRRRHGIRPEKTASGGRASLMVVERGLEDTVAGVERFEVHSPGDGQREQRGGSAPAHMRGRWFPSPRG